MATTVTLKPNAIDISGSTSGTTTLQATAVAGTTTLTLPAATDTLVGKATTDTLTNKTLTGAVMNGTVGATTPASGAFTTLSATGVTTVQAGTAALPAITTTGDTNTGIFFPAADTIAFTEGGAESMRIDSSGNVGIGVTPSTYSLGKAIEIGVVGAGVLGVSNQLTLSKNAYYNSGWKYARSGDNALQYDMNGGTHAWYNSASGTAGNAITFTQAMTLDASGNLGIGTSSPANKLDVLGSSYVVGRFLRNGTTTASGGVQVGNNSQVFTMYGDSTGLSFENTTSSTTPLVLTAAGNLGIGTSSPISNSGYGGLSVNGTNGAIVSLMKAGTETTRIFTGGDETSLQSKATTGYITFVQGVSGGTERMRIDSSGNLLVGTTSALATTTHSFVANGASSGAPMASRNQGAASGKYWTFGPDTSNNYRVFNNGGTGMYMVDGATAWTASSDERKKDIIEPIVDATNKVSNLRAVIGKYKTDANGVRRSFLIAQDVQAVFPEAVNASNPDELGVQYTDVIPLLVAAIKEQQILITTLTARITALESN